MGREPGDPDNALESRAITTLAAPHEFRLIADSAPVPMWLSGPDNKRRFVNRAYVDFLACDDATALEFDWTTLVHHLDRERFTAAMRAARRPPQVFQQREPFAFEARFRRHDGAWRWIHSVSRPVFGDDGAHAGFIGVAFDLTDAKDSEVELKARERRLSAYVNQAAAGFGEVDLAGRFTHVNDRFCAITGYSREDLLARTMQSITHPDDLSRNLPLFEAAVAHGTPYQHEKRYVRPDGSIIWVNNSVSVVRGLGDELTGVLAVCVDVTEHRRVAGELREAEERLRLATESAGIGAWDWDSIRKRGTFSEHGLRILGLPPGSALTLRSGLANVHPDDRDRFAARMSRWAEDGGEFSFEYRYLKPGGETLWLETRGCVLRDPSGNVSRAFGTVRDITVQRTAQDRLETLNRTLENEVAERTAERDGMWRLSHDLLMVLDPRLRIIAANPAAAELTGYTEEELVGRPLKPIIHPEDWRSVAAAVSSGRRAAVRNLEARLIARDGSVRDFCWNAAPEAGRAYVSGRDMTEERQRTRELLSAQEALRHAQKLEAIGKLTGGVAHDFNNLLSPIVGSLDLLRRRQVGGPSEQKLIAAALQSADRARLLVQRLLAFARRQPLALAAVDLARLLAGLEALLASTLGPTIALRVQQASPLPAVLADANQLEMAILNLAVNARDAMPDGGTLTISTAVERDGEEDAALVVLAIADTGFGMDAATLARATEPFFSTKDVGKGTGLGLSMVEGLTAQLGGDLKIDSRRGEGTTVRLRLPSASGRAEWRPQPTDLQVQVPAGCRVLLVDDEPLVRATMAEALRDRGFEVDAFDGARQALGHLAQADGIACVVTDYLMPGMNGIELARQIGRDHPGLPVLLVTGYAELDALSGDQPFLAKPCNADELVRRIVAMIGAAAQ